MCTRIIIFVLISILYFVFHYYKYCKWDVVTSWQRKLGPFLLIFCKMQKILQHYILCVFIKKASADNGCLDGYVELCFSIMIICFDTDPPLTLKPLSLSFSPSKSLQWPWKIASFLYSFIGKIYQYSAGLTKERYKVNCQVLTRILWAFAVKEN